MLVHLGYVQRNLNLSGFHGLVRHLFIGEEGDANGRP